MGLPASVRISIAKAIGQHLFDAPLAQAIVNVEAETAPTAVRVRFRTLLPAWATVEVFRMITGTIDLDMEPENLVATNVELFGNASTEHDVPVFGLEQERRYWYRISVPRKSPAEPKAKGQVRARGPFATRRQMLTIDISRIHLYDDSDDSSRGDLLFSAAFYDATRPGGPRISEPGFSAKLYRSSGDDIDSPFPNFPVQIERAPETVGIWVMGQDDDADPLPWEGLGLVGMYPPDELEGAATERSTATIDLSTAIGKVNVDGSLNRQVRLFSFDSARGALHYNVQGSFSAFGKVTLGPLPMPPWVGFLPHYVDVGGGKMAAGLRFEDGRFALMLGAEGRLSRRHREERRRWEPLDGPPLESVRAARAGGALMLVGLSDAGEILVAALRRPRRDQARWQETGLRTDALPRIAASPDGSAMLVAREPDGTLRLVSVLRSGRIRVIQRPLEPGSSTVPVMLVCRDGRTAIAWRSERGPFAACVDRRGEGEVLALEAPFPEPLAWAEDAEEGLLLLACDEDRAVGVLRFGRGERRWELLGPLDEVLEGPLEGVPTERPVPA